MNLSDIKVSKYLKKEDVGTGTLATIAAVWKENVAPDNKPAENKTVVSFQELDKPMVLNSTNGQLIAKISGVEEDIEKRWPGTVLVLYNDPNISYGGRLVGGIRVRAPKPGYATPQPPQGNEPPPHTDADVAQAPQEDDLPF